MRADNKFMKAYEPNYSVVDLGGNNEKLMKRGYFQPFKQSPKIGLQIHGSIPNGSGFTGGVGLPSVAPYSNIKLPRMKNTSVANMN